MSNESDPSTRENPSVRALGRWESEGGSLNGDSTKRAAAIQEEDQILQCLGAAVIMRWSGLPMPVKRELFASAASLGRPLHAAELKEQLARFLHGNAGAQHQTGSG